MRTIKQKRAILTKKLARWQKERELLIAQQDMKQDKKEIKNRYKEEKKALTMTKMLMLFLFSSCTIIEIFTLYVTLKSMNAGIYDFSALQMLITAVVGQVVAFSVYSLKSVKENTKGGIVYETAMRQYNLGEEIQG